MRFLDPAIRRVARRSHSLAGSLILEVQRRRGRGTLRTPADLLLEDASGLPGPALVEPVADWDTLLLPPEIDGDQVKGLARAAGKTMLEGGAERLLEVARDFPHNVRRIPAAITSGSQRRQRSQGDDGASDFRGQPAERAAWDRFLAAFDALEERQVAYDQSPSDVTAEQLRWAEVELEDAVAIAGELQVHNIRWILA